MEAHDYGGYNRQKPVQGQTAEIVNPVVTEQLVVNDVTQTRVKPSLITQPSVILGKPMAPIVNIYGGENIQPFKMYGITGYQLTPQVTLKQRQGK